jgi:hypothetical protein
MVESSKFSWIRLGVTEVVKRAVPRCTAHASTTWTKARGDIDAVAHQIAVALLDHVTDMNSNAELDPALRRESGVALDHAVLRLDGAAHGIHDATELDECAVARSLHDAPVMHGDGRIDQIAAQRSQPGKRAIFIGAGKPAVSDTSAASIAASFRVSVMTFSPQALALPLVSVERINRRVARPNAKFRDLMHGARGTS